MLLAAGEVVGLVEGFAVAVGEAVTGIVGVAPALGDAVDVDVAVGIGETLDSTSLLLPQPATIDNAISMAMDTFILAFISCRHAP
ncbi:hypothetical protein D3C84_1191770 [compost metagenome]